MVHRAKIFLTSSLITMQNLVISHTVWGRTLGLERDRPPETRCSLTCITWNFLSLWVKLSLCTCRDPLKKILRMLGPTALALGCGWHHALHALHAVVLQKLTGKIHGIAPIPLK